MNTPRPPRSRRPFLLAITVAAVSSAGCDADPRGLLDEISSAYRTAASYFDALDKPRITGTEEVDGHACTIVTIPKPDGPVGGLAVVVDFDAAAFGESLPAEVVAFDAPADALREDRLEPPQQIARRRQPDRFKLARAWRADGVTLPGNLLCLSGTDGSRTVALDGWRAVVVLDGQGRQLSRHELDLPPDAAVSFLRTAVDGAGNRWWLGGSRGGRQVFVFDTAWRLHASYPARESPPHAGVRTAQLVDLNRDGTPEIVVAYAGTEGVQVARLDGRRLWSDQSFDTVLDVVPDAPRADGDRGLVCVNGHGRLVPVRMAGAGMEGSVEDPRPAAGAAPEETPPDWSASPAVQAVFAGPVAPDGAWCYLGLAQPTMGDRMAVGLGPRPEQFWELDLPAGVHPDGPIEPVAWADLLGTPRRQWLIAAPDGTIVVAWADGRIVDRYRHGAPLVGIGGYREGTDGFIAIATREAVEGYRVEDVALD